MQSLKEKIKYLFSPSEKIIDVKHTLALTSILRGFLATFLLVPLVVSQRETFIKFYLQHPDFRYV